MGILSRFLRPRSRCPRCGSRASEERTRTEKEYVVGAHQPHESTSGWVAGHKEILVTYRHCPDCSTDFAERRKVVARHKLEGSDRTKKFGGYGVP